MTYIRKNNFFTSYIPIILIAILIAVGGFWYVVFYKPQSAEASIAFVQDSTSVASATITLLTPTVGDTIICTAANKAAATTVTSVTSTNINFLFAGRSNATNESVEIWYGMVSAGAGTTVTFNWSAASNPGTSCAEFSGVGTINTVDGTAGAATGSTGTATTGAYSTQYPNDIIIAGIANSAAAVPVAVAPYIALHGSSGGAGGNTHGVAQSYLITNTKGAQSTTFTGATTWNTVLIGLSQAGQGVNARAGINVRGGVKFR